MHPQIEQLRALILANDGSQATPDNILKLLDKVEKSLEMAAFKVQRTKQTKQIVTNVLKQTIEELTLKNEAIEEQKKMIEERSRFKEQLFANVSHELRTPLNGILGMSHLLKDTKLAPEQKRYVEVIKSSADNLIVIINDILNLSKINSNKVKINKQPFVTEPFFDDLHRLLNVKAQAKNLILNFNIATNIPSHLVGDRTRIYQILLNLLNNAIKFTHRGFVTLTVSIEASTFSNKYIRLIFEVSDTGIGIPQDKYNAIFESFTQVHEHGRVYEGAGLGLNIVKNLLGLMDGEIKVQSKVNKGTVFTAAIPFEITDSKVTESYEIQQNYTGGIPESWQHKRLLYIEDNEANILYAKGIINQWQMCLDIAETLSEAEQKLAEQTYDCILSDMILPDGNGVTYMANLRKNQKAINQYTPVIILTASANEKGAAEAKKLHLEGYLAKPFTPKELLEQLVRIFGTQADTTQKVPNTVSTYELTKINTNNTPAPCDKTYLYRLEQKMNGNKKYMLEMIEIFLQQIPVTLQNMENSIEKNDWPSVHFEAHKIKSTINIVGLDSLEELILTINEYTGKMIELDKVPMLFQHFKKKTYIDIKKLQKEKQRLMVAC